MFDALFDEYADEYADEFTVRRVPESARYKARRLMQAAPAMGYPDIRHILEGPILMSKESVLDAVFVFGEPIGETEVYPSLDVASKALEPWQLEEVFAVDGRGSRVLLRHHGSKVFAEPTEERFDAARLRQRAEDELRALGVVSAPEAGPLDLLQALVGHLGYAR